MPMHCSLIVKNFSGRPQMRGAQIFLRPLHEGYAIHPQNEPYFPCLTSMGRPHSGHSGALAFALACAEHTGCFCELYLVAVFPHTAQFIFIVIENAVCEFKLVARAASVVQYFRD